MSLAEYPNYSGTKKIKCFECYRVSVPTRLCKFELSMLQHFPWKTELSHMGFSPAAPEECTKPDTVI